MKTLEQARQELRDKYSKLSNSDSEPDNNIEFLVEDARLVYKAGQVTLLTEDHHKAIQYNNSQRDLSRGFTEEVKREWL